MTISRKGTVRQISDTRLAISTGYGWEIFEKGTKIGYTKSRPKNSKIIFKPSPPKKVGKYKV